MGIDIFSHVEVRDGDGWRLVDGDGWYPFDWRDYGMYGFLADVRNYSHAPVIAEPRGLPDDVTAELRAEHDETDPFSASWLTLAELRAFDYDQVFWDRRVERRLPSGVIDGAALAEEGEGEHLTIRSFLGSGYFADLGRIERACPNASPGDIRVVFWFD